MLRPSAPSSQQAGQVSTPCGRLRGLPVPSVGGPASHDKRLWVRQAAGACFAPKGGAVPWRQRASIFWNLCRQGRPYPTRIAIHLILPV